ncbi:MAG: AMP-binding protein [Eubacterium sp.]
MSQLYKKYFKEKLDDKWKLQSVDVHFQDHFNFAYDVLDVIAKESPDKRALVYKSCQGEIKEFTFGQISRLSNKMANVLKNAGIGRGSAVMLIMKRRYEFWIAMMALHKLGAVAIPTSHMVSGNDIKERIIKANIKAIICVNDNEICKCVEQAQAGIHTNIMKYIVGDSRQGYTYIAELMEKASDCLERVETSVHDDMLYYFTSGTTGEPKAVIHDYSYPIAHIMTAKNWHGVIDGGLHLTVADSGWAKSAWGKLYGQWFCQCGIMVYDYNQFYANEILQILEEQQITSFCAPPTIYKYLVRENIKNYDLSSLTKAVTAGEPMPTEVAKKFYSATGLQIREGFGQTETTLLTATMVDEEQREGSIGRPSPLYNMIIADGDNKEVPPGEIGEIVLIPEKPGEIPIGVFKGYLDDDGLYQEVWEGGVYHTKDRAYRDEDGYYYFVGRSDDVIKSSGYRIGPSEVEDILMKHPAVFECAVTGYPSATRGAIVKATIILNKGFEPDHCLKTELQDFVKERTAIYKYPRRIEFVEDLPRTVTGKISRKKIREADEKKLK